MSLTAFQQLFGNTKLSVIGMIHALSLPGTPQNSHSVQEIVTKARQDAKMYQNEGVDGILIENMADLPYLRAIEFGPEVVAMMTRICTEVRSIIPSNIPCGVQILAGGNMEALSVSKACGLQFIRSESFVFSQIADEGWMDACAGRLLRYRKAIGCENVLILTDIKKKHSAHAVTKDISLKETAKAAEFFLSDGLILTGISTGQEANPKDLEDAKLVTELPVVIGSGVTIDNIEKFSLADALIIGSHFKHSGKWDGKLDPQKIRALMEKVRKLRKTMENEQ